MTLHWMMRKLNMTSGLLREISFIAITWNPESNCTCREKNHYLFHSSTSTLPEIHTHIIGCILRENIDDHWNVDGEKELSDAWTGFTRFILLSERPPYGNTWSEERLTMKQTTSRPDNVWPDMWKRMSDAAKRKAKQKWIIQKPKVDNARLSSSLNQMMKNLNIP